MDGLECQTTGRRGISLGGLECRTDNSFEVGENETEIEHNRSPRTTDEQALLSWQWVQRVRKRSSCQLRQNESPREYVIRGDGPLSEPNTSKVVSGQLEPGLVLHARPMTNEGRQLLDPGSIQDVAVIETDG